MPKLDWLDNNKYLGNQIKKEYSYAAWACWVLALIILLIPVRGSAVRIHRICAAQDAPTLTGEVLRLERDTTSKQQRAYDARVSICYRGNDYTVTEEGFFFTESMYEQAKETGTVEVYLNPDAPEKSVLSKGIPLREWIGPTLFALFALILIITGIRLMIRSKR